MDNWYYKVFGEEFGPVTMNELVDLARRHTLSSNDEVRFGENGAWRRAGSMGQLMAHMPSGAHLPAVASVPSINEVRPTEISSLSDIGNSSGQAPAAEKTGWFYKVFGAEFGPVSIDELIGLAKSHTLSCDDEVRFGATGSWRRAGSLGQLMAHLPFQAQSRVVSPVAKRTPAEEVSVSPSIPAEIPAPPAVNGSRLTDEIDSVPDASNLWWCTINGKEYGPVDLPKLVSWASSGRLHRDDHVRFGQEPYVLAGELPGLFPELPTVAAVETKPKFSSSATTDKTGGTSPAINIPKLPETTSKPISAANIATPTSKQSSAEIPSRPVPPSMASAPSRPAIPIRRPPPKSNSNKLNQLMVPILGVVGVVLIGALIYLALPFLMNDNAGNIKRLKALESALAEVKKVRDNPGVKKDDFKDIPKKLTNAFNPVLSELKGKTGDVPKKLTAIANSLKAVAKVEDLTTESDSEKKAAREIKALKKTLKMK